MTQLRQLITETCDAIRAKKKTTEPIATVDIPEEIEGLNTVEIADGSKGTVYLTEDQTGPHEVYNTGNLTTEYPEEIWNFGGHTGTVNKVAIDDEGNIYSASDDKTVSKISPDGQAVWSYAGYGNWIFGLVAHSANNVYICGNAATVHKLSYKGEKILSFSTGVPAYDMAIDKNMILYIARCSDGMVQKVSTTGQNYWTVVAHYNSLHQPSWVYSVAVDLMGNVYGGTVDSILSKFTNTGARTWEFAAEIGTIRSISVDNYENIYCSGDLGIVLKIAPNGTPIWKYTKTNGAIKTVKVDNEGNVYVACDDGIVTRLDSGGKEIWTYAGHANGARCVTTDTANNVYSGGVDFTVRKISNNTKTEKIAYYK